MAPMPTYPKKGYLSGAFRVFRLKDRNLHPIPFHYHEFHKIIMFLGGEVDYIIEGKTYALQARDIVFVSAGEVHRPVFRSSNTPYERIVIYVAPDFLARWSAQAHGADLSACFELAQHTGSVMHQLPGQSHDLLFHMDKVEKTAHGQGFANGLYTEIVFMEFLILLHRSLEDHELQAQESIAYDPKIQQVLRYISSHLKEDLSIERLAAEVFLSRYHLMRKFKEATGYSLHQYIQNKRLILARDLLRTDMPVTRISTETGFHDYSTFSRAFHAHFHCSPKEWRKTHASTSSGLSAARSF